jgi:hypothetical protein
MYGIVIDVKVEPNREEEARNMLNNMIVPRARTHQGIVAGYWFREMSSDILRTIQVYDTEANARTTADRIRSQGPPPGGPVTLVSVTTYEVIAHL